MDPDTPSTKSGAGSSSDSEKKKKRRRGKRSKKDDHGLIVYWICRFLLGGTVRREQFTQLPIPASFPEVSAFPSGATLFSSTVDYVLRHILLIVAYMMSTCYRNSKI
jgi:hypothetical protein